MHIHDTSYKLVDTQSHIRTKHSSGQSTCTLRVTVMRHFAHALYTLLAMQTGCLASRHMMLTARISAHTHGSPSARITAHIWHYQPQKPDVLSPQLFCGALWRRLLPLLSLASQWTCGGPRFGR